VKLIPPYQVKPFVVGNKNDHNDAIAIAEASQRPKASFVPVKSLEQQYRLGQSPFIVLII
jgi:transposase